MSAWGDRLRERRQFLGMTVTELALKAGVATATAHDWESGKSANINGMALVLVAEALGTTARWIMTGEGDEPVFGAPAAPNEAEDIAATLRDVRKAQGLTQQHLAEVAGVSQSTIATLERGNIRSAFRSLPKVAEALGLDVSQIAMKAQRALDQQPRPPAAPAPSQPAGLDRSVMCRAVQLLEDVQDHHDVDLEPNDYADSLADVYELFMRSGTDIPYGKVVELSAYILKRAKGEKGNDGTDRKGAASG